MSAHSPKLYSFLQDFIKYINNVFFWKKDNINKQKRKWKTIHKFTIQSYPVLSIYYIVFWTFICRVGKSRCAVVSSWNRVYSYLLIIVLFSIWTTVNLLCPTPIFFPHHFPQRVRVGGRDNNMINIGIEMSWKKRITNGK